MHYGGSRKACMKFAPEPYMTLKPSGQEIPVNKELSVLDIQTLKAFYAPSSKPSSNRYKFSELIFIRVFLLY